MSTLWVAAGLLVLCGAAHDSLCALYTKAVTKNRFLAAALLSGALTASGYVGWLVMERSQFGGAGGVFIYAVGGALGTYGSLRRAAKSI